MKFSNLSEKLDDSKIFLIIYSLVIVITIDTSIVKISAFVGSFYYFQNLYNSLFIFFVAIFGFIQFTLLQSIKRRVGGSKMQSKLKLDVMNRIVAYASYAMLAILALILWEINISSSYSLILLFATVWISYGLTAAVLGILSYILFRWLKRSRSLVVLGYSVAIVMLSLNAIITVIFMTIELGDPESLIYPSTSPVGGLNISSLTLNSLYNITWISSFLLTWSATVIFLNYYSRTIGRVKYWILVSIPLVYFLASFQPFVVDTFLPFRQANPIFFGLVYTSIFSAAKPAGAVLFGIAFWALARKLQNRTLKGYILISSYGMIILFSANQPINLLLTPYPPFGLTTISFVGLSSYFVLIGIYSSAILVSEDSKIRQSIKSLAQKETKLLDSIGMAQMEREIERRVVSLTKQNQDRMAEESGIESSLTEEEVKEYLEQVIEEVKKRRESTS